MKNFRDIKVWQKAHQLTLLLYKITGAFPQDEKYGLVSQIKRSASSIAANIAEGCGKMEMLNYSPVPSDCHGLCQ